MEEIDKISAQGITKNFDVHSKSVGNLFTSEKLYPYKVQLLQELSEHDFDKRTELSEIKQVQAICNKLNKAYFGIKQFKSCINRECLMFIMQWLIHTYLRSCVGMVVEREIECSLHRNA